MADYSLVIGNKDWSSWSLRPWLALREAGIPFDEINISLRSDDTREQILKHSPSGKVPALVTGQGVIWDSLSILEFIAEQSSKVKLWPEDPVARAIARSVSAEMHSGFQSLRNELPMLFLGRDVSKEIFPAVQADIDRVQVIWNDCRARFGQGGDFLFGSFSVADAMYAPVVSRFTTYNIKLDDVSAAYSRAIWALDSMQEWGEGARLQQEQE